MKRPITVISIISIFLFAAALAWFGFGIYTDGKAGKEENERVFETLVFKTMSAANQHKIGTPEFSKKFIEAVGKIENYSSLKLDVNGKLVYSYPPSGFSLPSASLTNSFKKTNSTRDGLLITVSASMYAIQTNSVYHYAKFAFVLILLGTSISLILLVILSEKKEKHGNEIKFFEKTDKKSKIKNLFKKNQNKKLHKKDNFDDEFNFDYGDDENQAKNEKDSIFDLPEDDGELFNLDSDEENSDLDLSDLQDDSEDSQNKKNFDDDLNGEAQENKKEGKTADSEPVLPFATDISEDNFEIQDDDENQEISKTFSENDKAKNQKGEPDQKDSNIEPAKKESAFESAKSDENQNDYGGDGNIIEEKEKQADFKPSFDLDSPVDEVSPATGLKLQSSILPSLNEKIEAALENQKELTLALLKVNGLDRGNSISNKIVEILKDNIENQNDIFEYNSDGYAIILENEDLTSCADIFDKIYDKMTSYLRSSNSTNEVVVGLSSVNGRKVDAERLETEADQALAHALEDPDSPIIAFRANPEKYREYLDNQQN